ncbi:hypothetical protein [Elizabethkingia phage TCUEAP1]|nr:hypothetical protein [Elizabethkingia phage TCUEAP1]
MAITHNFKQEIVALANSLVGAELLDFSNLLYEKIFLPSEFETGHKVITGVRDGHNVPIINNQPDYESFPFVDASSCDISECDLNHNYSHYKWKLGLIECRIPICLRTFDADFLLFWNEYLMINPTNQGTQKYLKTALLQFLVNKVRTNLTAAKWRVAYFADESSTSPLFNGFNGIFAQAEAVTPNVVPIAKNSGANAAAQIMTGEEVYDTLRKMVNKYYETEWAGMYPVQIKVTKKMAFTLASYFNELKDKTCCNGLGQVLDAQGMASAALRWDKMAIDTIPIVPVREWDEIINRTKELNGNGVAGAAKKQPNRALLTSKDNVLIGTQNRDEMDMLEVWYDRTDRKVYIEAGAYLGAALPLHEFILAI